MIEKLYTIESGSLNPYLNMGLEEYLMYHTGREECILYLWQNERTVVMEGMPNGGAGRGRRVSGPPSFRRRGRVS